MPEIVTRHPELLIQEIKSAGIPCGGNLQKQILRTCPDDRFCRLPAGEICVYGLKEVPQMTQIHAMDLFFFPDVAIAMGALFVLVFAMGMIFGMKMGK